MEWPSFFISYKEGYQYGTMSIQNGSKVHCLQSIICTKMASLKEEHVAANEFNKKI